MGGLNSGPGPGITLLIAIVLVLLQTVSSAPLYEEDEGQESNSQALAESHGCYYNFQHYNEGERILTNEPCLNCTCRNRMLMCYLRVCPFTKGIGQNCTVEKVPGQCCPIITCPEVPVQLLTSTTTEGVKAPGISHGTKGTAVGHLDTNGCNIDGIFYPNGAQVPSSPEKPCELCYCIRNKTACIMQECALHVDGCRPVYEEGQCFPVRYQCDDSPYEEGPTTTIRPAPTPGLIITTTSSEPLDCAYNNEVYEDGSRIQTEDPCEHCYCLKGKIACAVQECGAPLEKEGQNCTALPPAPGKCCPDSYQCDITMTSQGNQGSEGTMEEGIPSVADAGHPTDGYHPDQTTRTTEEPHYTTNRLNQVTEAKEPLKQKPAVTPDVKPQELDKGTQNESTESHLEGLHSMKPSSTSDDDQKITFPDDKDYGTKPSEVTYETGRPEEPITKKPESEDPTTESHVIHMSHEKLPHPESESHKQDVPTGVPQTEKPVDHQMSGHPHETDPKLPNVSPTHSTQFHEQNAHEHSSQPPHILRPQTTAPNTKDPLLDKLHNIIQDVQSQVSDGKTTEMPEQTDYQTTSQSQTGHFTDKPDIFAHLPHFGSQTSTPGFTETGNNTSGSSSEEGNDIINKLQGIIQGIYSHVTDSVMSTKTPEATTVASDTQPGHSTDAGVIQPQGGSQLLTPVPEKESLKPLSESKYPEKFEGVQRPNDKGDVNTTEKPDHDDKYPSEYSTRKPKPEEEFYQTERPESTHEFQGSQHPTKTHLQSQDAYVTKYPEEAGVSVISEGSDAYSGKPDASKPQGSIKLPQRPKPSSADEPHGTKYPETTEVTEEESYSTENPYMTARPDDTKYPEGTSKYPVKATPENEDGKYPEATGSTKLPFDKEKYPTGHKPYNEHFYGTNYPENSGVTERPLDQSYHSQKFPSEKYPEQYPHKRPAGHYPEEAKPFEKYPEKQKPEQQHPEGSKPTGQYPEKTKPSGTEESSYGTDYSEGVTDRPDDYTTYHEGIRPTEYPIRKPAEQQSSNNEPGQNYSGTKPIGQHPEEYKPGQYPEEYKPFSQYPHGTKPPGKEPENYKPENQYPEVPKPLETEENLHGTDYPEGVTGRPDSESVSGHYLNKYKPEHQYPGGSKPTGHYPVETKPFVTEETPFGTEYSKGGTSEPEEYTKYPEVIKPTEKNPQEVTSLGQYPEGYQPEKYPLGNRPTGHHPDVARPEESYHEGSRPTAQQPDKIKPLGPDFTEYPESVTEMPESSTTDGKFPSELKPAGAEFTKNKTESLGSTPGKPEKESQNPNDVILTAGQSPEETEKDSDTHKPSDSHQNEKYPGGSNYPDEENPMVLLEKEKLSNETLPEGQDLDRVKPAKGPDHFTEPGNVLQSTEHPESVTGKPGEEGLHPTGFFKPGVAHGSHATEYPESSGVDSEPENVTKHPDGLLPIGGSSYHTKHPVDGKPHDSYENQEKQTESEFYGTESPEESGHPDGSTEYPEKFKPDLSTKYPQKNKPDYNLVTEYSDKTGTFKPEDENLDEIKPTISDLEDPQHPETSGSTDGSENQTIYPGIHSSSTQYPEGFIRPMGSEKPHDLNKKPSESEGSEHSDNMGVHDTSLSTEKYPDDSEHPVGTVYGTKYQEGVTDKLEEESKYPSKFRPTSDHPHSSKYPVTEKPHITGKIPEEGGITGKPEGESEYPEEFTSTDEYPHGSKYPETIKPDDSKLKPESHHETSGTEYPETSTKPVSVHEYSQSKYPEKNKPIELESFGTDHSEGFDPTEKYTEKEESKYPGLTSGKPEELGAGDNQLYSTEYPDSTEKPDQKYSEHLNENFLTESPDKNKLGSQYQGVTKTTRRPEYPQGMKDEETGTDTESEVGLYPGVNKRPIGSIKRPQRPKPADTTEYPGLYEFTDQTDKMTDESMTGRPEIGHKYPHTSIVIGGKPITPSRPINNENYPEKKPDTEHPDTTGVTEESGSEGEPHGTDFPEEVTGRPDDLNKYPDRTEIPSKHSQKFKPEFTQEGFTGRPEESVTESDKYLEETYTTHYAEKPKPPNAEDQLLETGTKPGGSLPQDPEKIKPSSEKNGISKPEEGTKYPEVSRPYGPEIYGHQEGVTNSPYFTTKRPQKPSDKTKPSASEYSEESPEHPEKLKPGKPKPDYLPSNTEYPETTKRPDELKPHSTLYPDEIGITGKPQDPSRYPEKQGDKIKHPLVPVSEEKPMHEEKNPQGSKYPTKTKPDSDRPYEVEIPETKPFGTEYPEGAIYNADHRPEKFSPTGSEKFGVTKRPVEGIKHSEKPENEFFENEYTGTGTERPKYPDRFKPASQELPHDTAHSEGQPHVSEYPEEFTTVEHSFETEYPNGEVTVKPENEDNIKPAGHYPGTPQSSTIYPEEEKPQLPQSDKHSTKKPDTTASEKVQPEDEQPYSEGITARPESTKLPDAFESSGIPQGSESSYGTEYPEGLTSSSKDHTKYPESFSSTEPYPDTPERPQNHIKFPEDLSSSGKPHTSESTYSTKYPDEITSKPEDKYSEGVTVSPDDRTHHPEGFKPTGQYPGITVRPSDQTKYPEKYKPVGEHDMKPHEKNKFSEVGKPSVTELPYGTEYSEGVTGFPYDATKYPEGLRPSEPGTSVGSGDQTEFPEDYKPTEQYPLKPHKTDKYPITGTPQSSERVTDRPQDHTKHPEAVSTVYKEDTKTPDDSKITPPGKHPAGSELTDSVYSTEAPLISGITEEGKPTELYSYESEGSQQTGKPLSHNETERPGVYTKLPEITKPTGSENTAHGNHYPEGIPDEPEYHTQYPSFRPTEEYTGNLQYTNKYSEDDKPQGSVYPENTEYPEGASEKPYGGTEYPETINPTDKHPIDHELHISVNNPDKSKYPTSEKPGVKYTRRPMPTDSNDIFNTTEYPEKLPIEEDTKLTEAPEHLSKLPEQSKPFESEAKPHGTEYTENDTSRPEDENFHEGISKRPSKYPQKPKPGIKEEPQGTESPEYVTSRPLHGKPLPNDSEEPHTTKYPDEPDSENEYHGTKFSEESGKYPEVSGEESHKPSGYRPQDSQESEKPYATEQPEYSETSEYPEGFHPTEHYSESSKKPHVPSERPQRPKPNDSDGSYDSAYPETTNQPEPASHSTEYSGETGITTGPYKRPKPTGFGDELFSTGHPETESDYDSATKLPDGFGKYTVKPKPNTEYPDVKPSKSPVEISSEDIEMLSTKLPNEEQKPEEIKPSGNSDSFETETPEVVSINKPVIKPMDEHIDTLGVTGKPHSSTEYSGNTELPSTVEVTKDDVYGVMKPAGSTVISTDELPTKYPDFDSTSRPENSYLPQGGQLPSEKIPSSEHLDEDSAPEISEYPAATETNLGFTDRIPATGSFTEKDLLSNLHQFEGNSDKPSSADLTHEHQTLSPNEQSGQHSTSEGFLLTTFEPVQPTAKPSDKTKPTGSDEIKSGKPVSADGYSGKPKPVVPGEELYNEKDSTLFPIYPSGNQRVPSTSEPSVHHPSTARPGTKFPGTQQDITGDVKYPGDVSITRPEDDHTKLNTHKDSASKPPTGEEASQKPIEHSKVPSESFEEHTVHEIHPEGTDFLSGELRPISNETNAGVSQGISQEKPEENSSEVDTDVRKPSTPADNDLINKLHNIISGIQSQVTKTTKLPNEGYHSTFPPTESSTESVQNLHPTTNNFDRPSQKPEDSDRPSQGQVTDSSNASTNDPSEFENEIYDQTTTAEDNGYQTDGPDYAYPLGGGSTEHSVIVPSKGPEGIRPDEVGSFLSPQSPDELVTTLYGSKPDKTESPELPTSENQPNLHSGQSNLNSKYPVNEIFSTGKPDGEFNSTEISEGRPITRKPEQGEKTSTERPYQVLTPDQAHLSDNLVGKPVTGISPEHSIQSEKATTQIPAKGTENTEGTANLTTEGDKVAPQQSITEDILHTVTPHDGAHKHTPSAPTDKPLHVVYPTYYPEGVITHKPGSQPDQEDDKKVTVTPENTPFGSFSSKGPESGSTVTPEEETHAVYEVQTEISSESTTSSSIVIIQEVHTEVHSERATTKPETEGYAKGTTKPLTENESILGSGKPHEPKPGHIVEGLTKYPEFSGTTPQVVFGQHVITHSTEDKLIPESQTLKPQDLYSESEKSPNLSTYPDYPAKQTESTNKPELVTVTPVGFSPVTKEPQHIMHLYSPKDKYPGSASSPQYSQSFTTPSPVYTVGVKHTTEKEKTTTFTESQPAFITDPSGGASQKPDIMGTRFPSRKTTQKPTDGIPVMQEGTTITPTEGIDDQHVSHFAYPGVTKQPLLVLPTQGLPIEVTGHTTAAEGITQLPKGASYVPYKIKNGTKVYFPEKETSQEPLKSDSSAFDGYDLIPYEIVNGTKFFYPNRVVTPPPAFTTTTGATQMGMYVPYKIVNGTKVYYTQDRPEKPEKFDGLDYVPFDVVNGTKVFYPERVTTTPPPTSAMYVPFKIINDTKVYYPKDAHDEPQNIPDEYDGFDYIPYDVVDGKKVFRPERLPGHIPDMTERFPAMFVPYKVINGNKVYYPKDAKIKPESIPQEYDGFDFVPYEVINGTKVFQPDRTAPGVEQTTQTPAMFVPYKLINGTKVYFPQYARVKPSYITEEYDGFDYLPYEDVNGTKIFHTEQVTQKPQLASTPAFYPNGMFVPYKIINNKKVFFPKDAQHKPRPLKPGYDGVQYLPYDIINGTKVFYPERVTTPTPVDSGAMYVPFKNINGTKVYYADKATESPEKVPEGYEGFDYLPYKIVNGNKIFYPDRVAPTTGMYVPYKKINGTKVYYPKDSSEIQQSVPEGYDGVDYIPFQMINGTRVFYPDRATPTRPVNAMYVPYKMVNGTRVYYPKDAQPEPYLVPEGYDGFDHLPYEIVNGTKVFHPEDVTERPTPQHSLGMFVPFKIVNGTKIYYPLEAHQRPHPLSDEYAGLDYIPYEIINGTKVFHPERVTPDAVPAMYVPYKLVNGTKMFYPKHAQHNPQEVPADFDGLDYVPYEIINGTQVFYPDRVPGYQGMYVPYKIINGEKVFYPKYAQHKPSQSLDGYDGFDYLPYENVNGTKVFKPTETVPETSLEQAMYVPYKLINKTKVFYPKYAQFKPHLIPEGYDGFDYVPYEIINGTKVFDPELAVTPGTPYKPAMYVPFKIINGKKVYYPKYAQNKPHLIPNGYDGFDYIPYEVINGTKVFDPQHAITSGTTFKPALYVPYKLINGMKVYQPKFAQQKPTQIPQGYDGFDHLPYDIVNGNKVFYPEQSNSPIKEAMYVPYKLANGTKVFYPKYAQYVLTEIPDGHDGFEYIPYEIVNGEKVFHPEAAAATETPLNKAMYVPYKIVNGTKVYYPKYAHYNPLLIPSEYDGFDYLPFEVVEGNKIFHPEQATSGTPFKQAMYVPFRLVNGTKVYYPNQAQIKPQIIPDGYDGFDYLPYEVVNGTKVFDSKVPMKPTYLQGMYVPYKLANNTKVFYPKDAHYKPNRVPPGYSGADYVPYELVNNTKMFYPELISTAQPSDSGSTGVYVPFKIINNKKVFYPKEATPFPPTVRHPYDGVAFVPNKALPGTIPSEIVYVDNEEALKPFSQPGQVPGEGNCYLNNRTFANNSEIPPVSPCQTRCICASSVVRCVRVKCPSPPQNKIDCSPVYREGSCCPTYACGDHEYPTTYGYPGTKAPEFSGGSSLGYGIDVTTPFTDFSEQKKPNESEDVKGGSRPEEEASSGEYHLHKPPKPKPGQQESLEPYDNVEGQLSPDEDYDVEDEEPYGPGTCRYAGKVYVSAQQIPRDDPCDFCFCFRSDIICLQQSCPPPIPGCRDEPIQGFCCPRYECHVKMATLLNVTSTTTTTTTTLPPHFLPHAFKGSATRTGCFVQGRAYRVGQPISSASGPCMDCICGGNGRMKCEPKVCTPEPMIRKMISPFDNTTLPTDER